MNLELHERLCGGDALHGPDPLRKEGHKIRVIAAGDFDEEVGTSHARRDREDLGSLDELIADLAPTGGLNSEHDRCENLIAEPDGIRDRKDPQCAVAWEALPTPADEALREVELAGDGR